MNLKFLREDVSESNEIELVTEKVNGKQNYYLTGPFLQAETQNKNKRIYPMPVMEKAVNLYVENNINRRMAYGELCHPSGPDINLDRVSHLVTELKKSGNTFIGKAKIIEETPCGKIVSGLLRAGANLGVSSRGMGSLKEDNGVSYVQDDFKLATAADVVADPSAPDAYVQGLMESAPWVWENGLFKVKDLEESKKLIQQTSLRKLQEAKLKAFMSIMRDV